MPIRSQMAAALAEAPRVRSKTRPWACVPTPVGLLVGILILAVPVVTTTEASDVTKDYWRYYSVSYGAETFWYSASRTSGFAPVFAPDKLTEVEVCKPEDDRVCFWDGAITFAFPKEDELVVGSTWRFRNHTFRLAARNTQQLLGRSMELAVIEARSEVSQKRVVYLYAKQHGVVMFQSYGGLSVEELHPQEQRFWDDMGRMVRIYVSADNCGIGCFGEPDLPR